MSAHTLTSISCSAIVLSLIFLPAPIAAQSGQVQADTSKPLIEMRFARRAAAEGFRQMTDPQSSSPIYVSGENVFTDADFADVRARMDRSNGLMLATRWMPDAAVRFAKILRSEVGAGNEMLAVFIGGELVNAPVIAVNPDVSVTPAGVSGMIAVPVAGEKVRQIQEAVAKRWPRSPSPG